MVWYKSHIDDYISLLEIPLYSVASVVSHTRRITISVHQNNAQASSLFVLKRHIIVIVSHRTVGTCWCWHFRAGLALNISHLDFQWIRERAGRRPDTMLLLYTVLNVDVIVDSDPSARALGLNKGHQSSIINEPLWTDSCCQPFISTFKGLNCSFTLPCQVWKLKMVDYVTLRLCWTCIFYLTSLAVIYGLDVTFMTFDSFVPFQ